MESQRFPVDRLRAWAAEAGFVLCGVAPALPIADAGWFHHWVERGYAGEMRYLADHRAAVRDDPRNLLPSAQSIVCVGMLYNGPEPHSTELNLVDQGWIARYAWGDDYHNVIRRQLESLDARMRNEWGSFDSRICVDTAPLLERSYARAAGLGWIGKNTCLINQQHGSWFLLGEILTSLPLASGEPPPDRCGTCTRCIDACPTNAIVPRGDGRYTLDSRLCISYFTIELRGTIPEPYRDGIGAHVFGCDICQDVCPWNHRAPTDCAPECRARPGLAAPNLEWLAGLSADEFRAVFRDTPVWRAKYSGFLRNVAIAMGNTGHRALIPALERLSGNPDPVVAQSAVWAIAKLEAGALR